MPTDRKWKPYAIGLAVTVIIVAAAWAVTSRPSLPSGTREDAYAPRVAIQDAQVLGAESLMGGSLVYYRGQLSNQGGRTLTGYFVTLTFHDIDGKPIETVRRSLLDQNQPPSPPHASHSFEIGFDKFPPGWNQAPPTPHAVAVYVR